MRKCPTAQFVKTWMKDFHNSTMTASLTWKYRLTFNILAWYFQCWWQLPRFILFECGGRTQWRNVVGATCCIQVELHYWCWILSIWWRVKKDLKWSRCDSSETRVSEQVCSLTFGSWTFKKEEVQISYHMGKRQVCLNAADKVRFLSKI